MTRRTRREFLLAPENPRPGQLIVDQARRGHTGTLKMIGSVDRWTAGIVRKHVGFVIEAGLQRVVLDLLRAAVNEGGTQVLAEARAMAERAGLEFAVENAGRQVAEELDALAAAPEAATAAA